MRDRLIELVCKGIREFGRSTVKCSADEYIADHLLANGVIVPPCKVGDTIYYIAFGKIYKGKCHAITLKHTLQIHLYDFDGDRASYPAKKVFLTKEEAERALKEREKG